jgi:predicted 2-oxoglutarate/Fe(II)-dependent dioxygenase YbiX
MYNLKDYIVVLKDIVPDELCDAVLAEYSASDEWGETAVGDGKSNKKVRNCDTIQMSQPFVIRDNKERARLDAELFLCAENCITQYNNKFEHARIQEDTGYELLRYKEGEFYKQHVDSFLQAPRLVSCSFHLNDDYEGGEFGFFDREMKIKAGKGDVVMFPSTFMYPHEIMPVTEGTRYSIITWYR